MTSARFRSRRTRAAVAAAAIATASTLLLAACGGGSSAAGATSSQNGSAAGEPITLTFQWWGNDDRAKATQAVVDLYTAKHPNVKIETSFGPDASYWEKMATQVAGGNTPDIFQMKLEYLKEYAARDVIVDLTDRVSGDKPAIATADMQEQYLKAGQIDGKTFGIPTGRSTQAFIYDPVAWAALGLPDPTPGWTWDDLKAAGEKVKQSSGGAKAIMSDPGNDQAWFETWLLQHGKSVYTSDGKLNFDQSDLEKFWTFTTDFASQGIFTPANVTTANDWTMANSPVVKGTALAEVNNVSLASAYFQSFGEVKLGAIPADKGSASTGSYAGATQLLVIGKKSQHADVAADFINFFLNDPEAGKISGLVRGLPTNKVVLDALAPEFKGGDLAVYNFEQGIASDLVAKPPVAPKGGSKSLADFKNVYDRIIFDQVSVKDGAAEMFAKFKSNIA